MDHVKNTISVQGYPLGKQSSFISIQEDGSTTCLKHVVGYASPKLTPKHTRSVKQSKRKTKTSSSNNHENNSPHLEFPPPPSYPPPEHYNLSDEYSADLIDADVPNCKTDYHLNDNLVRFRTTSDDQPPEGFWNSPVEAPWSYFLGNVPKKKDKKMNEGWIYEGKKEKVTDLDDPNEFWENNGNEEGWIFKNVESSTPYMERKGKVKKKAKKKKEDIDEVDQVSEEIMLINKLKEDSSYEENGNGDVQGFRNEIWVNSAPANDAKNFHGDNSTIQITKNHISNVLITHGNDEVLDNFIENKPIHAKIPEDCEVRLVNNYQEKEMKNESEKCKNGIVFPNNQGRLKILPTDNRKYQVRLNTELSLMGDSPDEYSYAYYEPGPVNKVIMTSQERKKYEYDRNSRHTYTTRYGTEENIYEEITEVSCNFKNRYVDAKLHQKRADKFKHARQVSVDGALKHEKPPDYVTKSRKSQSQISLNQSIVEEEVREVQSTHRRVLGQLNLTMEAMLMPNSIKEKDEIKDDFDVKKEEVVDDNPLNQITDLDSGFSGSSGTSVSFYGGSNYVKSVAPFRRPDLPRSSVGKSVKYLNAVQKNNSVHSDMIDYRSAGYCPDSCCAVQASYPVNGRVLPGRW